MDVQVRWFHVRFLYAITTMLDSTLELITQAVSNSLFIFCCCNLIILVIFIGSKSGSDLDQESEIPVSVPMVTYTCPNVNKVSSKAAILSKAPETRTTSNGEDDNGDSHDELRRRVEGFIEKVNRGWRAELVEDFRLSVEVIPDKRWEVS
ncbi:hypothetical protein K2173_026593 [Erythroxylum novogranatense]|uniref:Uncharacterized protein n=1 Tax=Erythroxylum novogranatense TaxID=1862640 RepID=A0AAV8TWP1_9ROSI|nr:hypothetical protein K2173_026593 [Erythroxylum novogranatense]